MINLIIYAALGIGGLVIAVLAFALATTAIVGVFKFCRDVGKEILGVPERIAPLVPDPYWRHQSRLQYEAWARMDREKLARDAAMAKAGFHTVQF
jgi:hypothetical protein